MTSANATYSKNLLPESFFHALHHCFPSCKATATLCSINKLLAGPAHLHHHFGQYLDYWLDSNEQKTLASYKLAKRRNEWLAGRICAKLAITNIAQKSTPLACNTITIANDDTGRPYVRTATVRDAPMNFSSLDISISHSGSYAAAAASTHYCGIDIQEPRTTLERVQKRFCSEDEKHLLREHLSHKDRKSTDHVSTIHGDTGRLNLLWAAKEAIRKSLSHSKVPDFLALHLFNVEFPTRQWHIFHLRYVQYQTSQADRQLRVLCGHYQEYALALCIEEKK